MDGIFYKSDIVDAYSGAPVYVFDTSYLPSTDDIDYDLFIPTMMLSLPSHPYQVIMFSGGLNRILWIWGVKFLKSFLADHDRNVENLRKVIAVHESWFVRSITQLLTTFSFSKTTLAKLNLLFDSKKSGKSLLTSCDDLSDLSNYVDVSRLKLSLNIYKHDAQVTMSTSIAMSFATEPLISANTRFCAKSDPVFYHHFYQLFNIVDMYAPNVELLFHKPGNRLNTDILFNCMLRNQLLSINDWDLYCIASCFKKILMEVAFPLIPVDLLSLPMRDDLDYLLVVFNHILASGAHTGCDVVVFQLMDLSRRIVDNHLTTKHTYVSILRNLCHALTKEPISHTNKDRISMAVRFIKNLLLHWNEIRPLYYKRFKSVSAIVHGDELHDETIDELYNMSYDITVDAESDEDASASYDFASSSDLLLGVSDLLLDASREDTPRYGNRSKDTLDLLKDAGKLDLSLNSTHKGISLHAPEAEKQREITRTSEILTEEKVTENAAEISLDSKREVSDSKRDVPFQNTKENESGKLRDPSKTRKSKLNDVSNVQLQWPPQKYKFDRIMAPKFEQMAPEQPVVAKKPVVRGRKVGELARLFEERSQAFDLLRTL